MNEIVPAALGGERIDRVVAMLTGCSRAEAAALVGAGAVRIGDRAITSRSHRVVEGDVVAIELAEVTEAPALEADAEIPIRVVHEDPHLLVVDKPPGLVVHPGAGTRGGTLVHGLLARHPELAGVGQPDRPGIVHRLDKGTSGLLLVARTAAAYEALVAMLAAHEVHRTYRALVWGHPAGPSGLVDAPVGRSAREPTRMAVTVRGKVARTRYEVLTMFDDPVVAAELRCELETGRTHQIRVHLSSIGHPVIGDARYRGARTSLPAPRPMLHAERLALRHPVTGADLALTAPLPDDFRSIRERLA